MEKLKGRTVTFRNPDQFLQYLTANKITEVFVHPAKKGKYNDEEFDGHDIFEAASEERNLLVRYESRFVIPRQKGTDLDSKGRIVDKFKNKKELLEGLKDYGAPVEMLAKLQSAKASELKEFFDNTKADQENESAVVESTSVSTVRTTPNVKETLVKHEHFKLAEISYDGHCYYLTLTLKVTPNDIAKSLRGKLHEAKFSTFDAKLALWQTTPEG